MKKMIESDDLKYLCELCDVATYILSTLEVGEK